MKYIFSLKCKNNMIKYNDDLKYMKIDKKNKNKAIQQRMIKKILQLKAGT